MHGDRITLTRSEQRRLLLLNHLQSGALVNAQAASLLGISIRQVRRLRRRYEAEGAAALAHGNRGRRPVWEDEVTELRHRPRQAVDVDRK